jgi:hypothetical protein
LPIRQGTSYDGAESLHAEDSIQAKPGPAQVWPIWLGAELPREMCQHVRQAAPGACRDTHDWRILKYGPLHAGTRLSLNNVPPFAVVNQIGFGECDHATVNAQEVYDGQVLGGLRHDTFVCCDNQQYGVNACHACQHVLDKIAVTRNIHNPDLPAIGQRHPPESQVDGHLAGLFFFKAVWMRAGQGFNQGRLAVVDVTSCPHYSQSGLIVPFFIGLLVWS